jgi:AraC-like DNA-binding protein
MSLTLSAIAVFPLAGAVNAAIMSAAIGARAIARRSRAGIYGAVFLGGAAAAVTVITLDHAGAGGMWLSLIEGSLTLGGGATFALFIAALIGRPLNPLLMFAPAAAFLLSAPLAPEFVLHQVSVEFLVLAQAAFTALSAWMAFGASSDGKPGARRLMIARASVIAIICIHLAQAARFVSDADALRDIVPYVTATIFFVLAGLVYFGAKAAALEPILAAHQSSGQSVELLERLDAVFSRPELLRKGDLSLTETAASAGLAPKALSSALASERGLTFKEYLLRARVREAERLLRDPGEVRTSMEAIGLLAGFGSRSAFYKAFREQTGVSPAAYRAEICPET